MRVFKLIPLVVLVGLLFFGVAFATDFLAGNPATHRQYTDTRTNFYLVDKNNPFSEAAEVTGWSVYAKHSRPIKFLIYRNDAVNWSVVYTSDVVTPAQINLTSIQLKHRLMLKQGIMLVSGRAVQGVRWLSICLLVNLGTEET
jgi:hypothetical protein